MTPPSGAPRVDRPRAHRPSVPVRRGAVAAGLVLVGAILVTAAVLGIRHGGQPTDVGAGAARALASASPGSSSGPPAPAATGRAGPGGGAVPVRPGTLPTAGTATVAPVRLAIPALGLTAPVVPVGVAGDQLDVPADGSVVGWYRYGPGLDEPAGSTVLAGHVDTARGGPGAFYRLRTVGPGTSIEVSGPDGRVRRYRAVAREEYPKTAVPLDRYFALTGAARLTLVTCGGPFDDRSRHYRDNVVITAEPIG